MPVQIPGYWVELRRAERTLGAGFLVAHRRVLTAAHCVRGLSPDADLTVAPTVGNPLPARLEEIAERADLALVELLKDPYPEIPRPRTSCCHPRDDWFGPYRPSESDPHLSGSIVHDSVDYECVGGAVVRALQLTTAVELGDYRGYSGGPIERLGGGDIGAAVVGILVEQYPDRAEPGRYANVLFAVALGEALRQFHYFDIDHLLPVIVPTRTTHRPSMTAQPVVDSSDPVVTAQAVARADTILSALQDWARRGLLDPGEVRMLRVRVARSLVDE
jgi:hypothetical protein